MSTTAYAYAAGIIDGEGTIGIWKEARSRNSSGYRFRIALEVSNTKEQLIDWFAEQFGGFKAKSNKGNDKHQPLWKWRCTTSEIPFVLAKIEPYLLIKQNQLQLAKRFVAVQVQFNQRSGKRQGGEALQLFEELWLESKGLNHRGTHSQEPPGS